MQMSKKQAEFFTILIIICTATAAAILLIDFQIKGAILEESTRMRKELERYYGQRPAAANASGHDSNAGNDLSYPSDLVAGRATGVEETGSLHVSNGKGPAPKSGRARSTGKDGPGSIPGTGQ
jgi:hypothetical protein